MKKLGAVFYIVLALLTAAVLVSLSLWIKTRDFLYLYFMLVVFAAYLFHLVFNLVRGGKNYKREELERSKFLLLAGNKEVGTVYITYLGNERRTRRPSRTKKDYLVEFYSEGVDREALKRHLWFDLPEKEERLLAHSLVGEARIPYPLLKGIKDRTILIQTGFYEAAKGSPLFADFLDRNQFILYGESE